MFIIISKIICEKSLMNPVKPNAARPAIGKWLNLTSRTLFKGQTCEEVDCCGKTIKAPLKPDEPVVEKDIEPSYFCTWKPTIPILAPAPEKKVNLKLPMKKRVCYAGMPSPKCSADVKEEAKECFKRADPRVLPQPKIQSCKSSELAQMRSSQSTSTDGATGIHPSKRKVTLPEPDWDHNCIMD